MANIDKALKVLFEAEFDNMPQRFLHRNKTENFLTLGGVNQKANPYNIDWKFCEDMIDICDGAITRASNMLFYDETIQNQVKTVFLNKYWNVLNLSKINSQLIANEIFLFGVVSGIRNGGKLAQKIAGVVEDGIIGNISIGAINKLDDLYFSQRYDNLEILYFQNLVDHNANLSIYMNGWKKRALMV